MKRSYNTAIVFLLGYPGMGKRTVGGALATLIDAVLLDNARIHGILLEPFRWDGIAPLPPEIWDRVTPIRDALLGVIEDLAPASNSYVFTNALEDEESSAEHYASIKSLAARRGSLFLAVQLDCNIDVQVSRIDNPDRIALRKGADSSEPNSCDAASPHPLAKRVSGPRSRRHGPQSTTVRSSPNDRPGRASRRQAMHDAVLASFVGLASERYRPLTGALIEAPVLPHGSRPTVLGEALPRCDRTGLALVGCLDGSMGGQL